MLRKIYMTNIFARRLHRRILGLVTVLVSILVLLLQSNPVVIHASRSSPVLKDPNLRAETIVSGLEFPTGMAFLGQNDVLVIEKDTGKVKRIIDGEVLKEPLLDVNVANEVERGLLGIAVSKRNIATANLTYVFLLYTESEGKNDGGDPVGNHLYRYELIGNKLVNPKLLLDLPYRPGPAHNGGVISIGPDDNVYVIVGNLYSPVFNQGGENNLVQNVIDGKEPDGRGGIIRVTQDGQPVGGKGILGDEHPLDMYYAYGIRNSFGIGFDPVTGNLWDTENGGRDEINLVGPGFNSGWTKVSGMSFLESSFDENDLADFEGKGKYSDPELDLGKHTAPTAITFLPSDTLGKQYQNQLFIGTTGGIIFDFRLNEDRTGLVLTGSLEDKVSNDIEDLEDATFAEVFETITDLEVGPDGYLYGTSYAKNGTVFRIVPSTASSDDIK
jgi:aldose sugar dehydrogenase